MKFRKFKLLTIACMLLGCGSSVSQAQNWQPFGPTDFKHDLQPFSQFEVDLDGRSSSDHNGYFASYDRTTWSVSGNRAPVGRPEIERSYFHVWPVNLQNPNEHPTILVNGQVINILPGIAYNSIESGTSHSEFDLGTRYEFGYRNRKGRGWVGSVVRFKQDQSESFGKNPTIDGTLVGPFGDVTVAYKYAPGYMHGWVDVWDGLRGAGRLLNADTDGDGILDGDGFADDVNGNGFYGPDGQDTVPPIKVPDADLPASRPDYGDLVELPTSYHITTIRNVSKIDGFELMRAVNLSNRSMMAKKQANTLFELYYGLRFYRFNDQFIFSGEGGTLKGSLIDSRVMNNLFGPQIGLRMDKNYGRWSVQSSARMMFAYNHSLNKQNGFHGKGLNQEGNDLQGVLPGGAPDTDRVTHINPGHNNQSLSARHHLWANQSSGNNFSPLVEVRFETNYHFTKAVSLNAGWTANYVGKIFRAADLNDWVLDNPVMQAGQDSNLFVHGFNIGIEFRQ